MFFYIVNSLLFLVLKFLQIKFSFLIDIKFVR